MNVWLNNIIVHQAKGVTTHLVPSLVFELLVVALAIRSILELDNVKVSWRASFPWVFQQFQKVMLDVMYLFGILLTSISINLLDDDECLFGNHNCDRLGPEWKCRNTLGSFRCEKVLRTCPSGLKMAPNRECRPPCLTGFEFSSRGECIGKYFMNLLLLRFWA